MKTLVLIGCTWDTSRPAAVENVQWRRSAVYLDAVTIGLQGRHWTIQDFEHFIFIAANRTLRQYAPTYNKVILLVPALYIVFTLI